MKKNIKIFILFAIIVYYSMSNSNLASASDGWGNYGDNITWNYTESSGVLEIKGNGDMPVLSYLSETPWYNFRFNIRKVVISEGVTSIVRDMFSDYSGYHQLKEVQLPSTMKRIGDYAFKGNKQLTTINFPNGLTEIGVSAFEYTGLTSITIPGTVKEIAEHAFEKSALTSITLCEGIQKIGEGCFLGTKLRKLLIPSSVTEIGGGAFSYCSVLTDVEIPSNVTKIGDEAFRNCYELRYATVNAVANLSKMCFAYNDKLEMVKIGNSVQSIGSKCFVVSSLKAVYVPKSVSFIDGNAFASDSTVVLYGYTGSAAWDYAGSHNNINFIDVSTVDGKNSWDTLWTECVNRKETANPSADNIIAKKKSIKILAVKTDKGKKTITIRTLKDSKIVIIMNKKILKKGKKRVKKLTIKKCKDKTIIKLSKKLPKNTKITVRVTKSGYIARSKMMLII